MIAIEGIGEVIIAEQMEPLPPIHAQLEDFVSENSYELSEKDKVDFYAPKVIFYETNQVIARKIQGRDGTPGKNIFGEEIPCEEIKDFELKIKEKIFIFLKIN